MFLVDVLSSRLAELPQPFAGHAFCQDFHPMRPLPLPEALRKNHLAMEVASATPTEACRLYRQTLQQKAALSLSPALSGLG